MAANREALAQRALKELRLIGEGQSVSASEMADALAAIPPLLARLEFIQVFSNSNTYAFSDAVFQPLAILLAEDLAPSLAGRPKDAFRAAEAEAELRRIERQPLVRNALQVDQALQSIGNARRRWL